MSTAFSPQETNEPKATPGGSIVSDLLVAACILGGGYLVITGLGVVAYRLYGAAPVSYTHLTLPTTERV